MSSEKSYHSGIKYHVTLNIILRVVSVSICVVCRGEDEIKCVGGIVKIHYLLRGTLKEDFKLVYNLDSYKSVLPMSTSFHI